MTGLGWFYLYFIISCHSPQLQHFWQQNENIKFNRYTWGELVVVNLTILQLPSCLRGKKYTNLMETEEFQFFQNDQKLLLQLLRI